MLLQDNIYKKGRNYSLKSRRQHSQKAKQKNGQKRRARHENGAYPEIVELNVPMNPRCNVECHSYKIDVRDDIYNVHLMSFDKIEVVTCMLEI